MTTRALGLRIPRVAALGAADWLSFAATPTFAAMALLTGVAGGLQEVMCLAMQANTPLSGMAAMYLLMSVFHIGPWLRLMLGK